MMRVARGDLEVVGRGEGVNLNSVLDEEPGRPEVHEPDDGVSRNKPRRPSDWSAPCVVYSRGPLGSDRLEIFYFYSCPCRARVGALAQKKQTTRPLASACKTLAQYNLATTLSDFLLVARR